MRRHQNWLDQQDGPVVRPYMLTGGRTAPDSDTVLDLVTVIAASGLPPARSRRRGLSPEHRRLLSMVQEPVTVADVAADVGLPLGVIRILLADLIQENLVGVRQHPVPRPETSQNLLQEVLDGLRAL